MLTFTAGVVVGAVVLFAFARWAVRYEPEDWQEW